ncbi:hypothetical protein ACRRTK_005710 [Alexandromys fortis]
MVSMLSHLYQGPQRNGPVIVLSWGKSLGLPAPCTLYGWRGQGPRREDDFPKVTCWQVKHLLIDISTLED